MTSTPIGERVLAPDLARAKRTEQVDDLRSQHTHRVHAAGARHRRQRPVAGMRAIQVVGDATPETIELDASPHHVAGRKF